MLNVIIIIVISCLVLIAAGLMIRSGNKKNMIKRVEKLVFKNAKKRQRYLADLTEILDEEEFFSLLSRDLAFYRFSTYYPFQLNSDLPAFIPRQAGLDKISEYEFKSLISSQNSLLREKAARYMEEFSYLRKFIIGIVERENEEFLLERYLKSITFEISDDILVEKLHTISSRPLIGLIFEQLLRQGFIFSELENHVEKIEDSFLREFCLWILRPYENMDRLIMEMAQEESDEMFTFISTYITSLEEVDIDTIEKVIAITENRRFSSTYDIAGRIHTLDNIKVFYSVIDKFSKMDELSRVYIINRAFFYFRNIKLCAALIEQMPNFKDRQYEILLKDIVINSEEAYLVRVALQALHKLDAKLEIDVIKSLYRRWDEEVLYYAVVFLLTDDGFRASRLLKKIYKKSSVFIRKRIKKLSTRL